MNQNDLRVFRNDIKRKVITHVSVKENVVLLDSGNSWQHEQIKTRICYELQKLGKKYITECPVPKIGGSKNKIDILILDDAQGIEIMVSETEEQLTRKVSKCPDCIEIIGVRNWTDVFDETYKVIKPRLL